MNVLFADARILPNNLQRKEVFVDKETLPNHGSLGYFQVQALILYSRIMGQIAMASTPEEVKKANLCIASHYGICLREPSYGKILTLSEREEFSDRIIFKCVCLTMLQSMILRRHQNARAKFEDFADASTFRAPGHLKAYLCPRTEALINSVLKRQAIVAKECKSSDVITTIDYLALTQFYKLFNCAIIFVDGDYHEDTISSLVDREFLKQLLKFNRGDVVKYDCLHIVENNNIKGIKDLLAKKNTMVIVDLP